MNSWQQKMKAAATKGVILPDTTKETLQELAAYGDGYPQLLGQMFLDYSAPAQRLKMYSRAWQNMYIIDGWCHPRFWQVGTDTLRFSSSDPNFQQIPKDGRKIVGNVPGYSIISGDFSQIEVRIAAEISHDERLIEILKEGDAHTGVAMSIYQTTVDKVTPTMRKHAKAATFTLLFGGSHKRLYSYARNLGLEITEDEAYEVFTKFFQAFAGLRKIREQAFAMRGRRVVSIRFPNGSKRVLIGRNVTPTRILNTTVQGPAAIGMKYAMFEAESNGIWQYVGSTVHDELVLVVPNEKVAEVSALLEKSMIDGMHKAFPNMVVKVEVKSGEYWQA
jgi:DNA polymerase I-like protein with 3'-5' exonuclease and polymerase domains